jgi:Cu/Ag efflux protein CusF
MLATFLPIKTVFAFAVALSVSCSTAAEAGRKVATGQIKAIDSANRTISLSSGEIFRAGPKVKLSTRHIGEKVIVVYETADDGLQAIKVRRVPQQLEVFVPLPEKSPNAQNSEQNP